ncbi:MAG: type VI secretion system baseplate subunit TssF [Acidobacteria bacterium]|nr:type VI secretion system baseplate subunit TssF [Acidobacteriota bacterium]
MSLSNSDDFLFHYQNELSYLRKMGSEFAEKYPRIAARLELGADECPDPHVERLLESFAFLTARIQQNIASEFPVLTTGLLDILYPALVTPVPSLAIAQFLVAKQAPKLTTGHLIPKHTPLFTHLVEDVRCRFRTCYPVHLWPLEVKDAGFARPAEFDLPESEQAVQSVLKLRLTVPEGTTLQELSLKRLRFYLHGERELTNELYELLFCNTTSVLLEREGGRYVPLPPNAILPVGFAPDEEVLPYPAHSHPAFRLVQEYFVFSKKFRFFDVDHLDQRGAASELTLLFLFDRKPKSFVSVDKETFRLGCTPIINLFPKATEPIRLDQRQSEYRLVADMRRERFTEIHSIAKVSAKTDPKDDTQVYEPYYSFNHAARTRQQKAFWLSRRADTGRKDLPGTDMFLSFVDLDFTPSRPPEQTVYAHTYCTNRNLAEQLPANARLQPEENAPLHGIVCLGKPTSQIYPPLRGATLWRLVSHLSLNHLSLSNGPASRLALQEILRLYSLSDKPYHVQQIEGISELECRRIVGYFGQDAWRGFTRGLEISVTFDENQYVGSGAFLLATVLNHFLALYAPLNQFTQMVIKSKQREGVWKKWPPVAGDRLML